MIEINDIDGGGTTTNIYWTPDFDDEAQTGACLARGRRDGVDVVSVTRGHFRLMARSAEVATELDSFARNNEAGFPALEEAIIRAAFKADPPTHRLLSLVEHELKSAYRDGESFGKWSTRHQIQLALGIGDAP